MRKREGERGREKEGGRKMERERERKKEGGREREGGRKRERELDASRKCGRALSVPYSVSLSACVIIILNFSLFLLLINIFV